MAWYEIDMLKKTLADVQQVLQTVSHDQRAGETAFPAI